MSTPRILFKKLEQTSISRPKQALNPSKSTKKVEINVSQWANEEDQLKQKEAMKIASEYFDKKYPNSDFEQTYNNFRNKKKPTRPMTGNFEINSLKQKLKHRNIPNRNIKSATKLNEFN